MEPTASHPVIRKHLAAWFEKNKRDLPWRATSDPYAIWVSEVMLQQTQVKTVIPYYRRFLDRFPDVAGLAASDPESVYKLWEGLGYYSRARNLHRAAGILQSRFNGRIPRDPDTLRTLPGIGEYIGAAVSSIAFGHPSAVVDGNVKRVLARLFLIDAPANQQKALGKKAFRDAAAGLLDPGNPGMHNQAVMELGALVCTPANPRCGRCPLNTACQAFMQSLTSEYPRRNARPAPPLRRWAACVIERDGRVLMTRRPAKGLLGGFWEFPCISIDEAEPRENTIVVALRRAAGINVSSASRLAVVDHTYTHFRLRMNVYRCGLQDGPIRPHDPDAFRWVLPEAIQDLPLHKAVHKALPAVMKNLTEGPQ